MSEARTVLQHLLEGREALVLEVDRLTTAIEELDTVIDRVSGSAMHSRTVKSGRPVTGGRGGDHVNPRTGRARGGSKSIRVHVLEMLASEDRDFGLAEIIDRIHAAGIRAHDDAVRSITVKLMKDGTVQRVGRGQYRLARHAAPGQSAEPAPAADPVSLNLGQPWQQPRG